jgi:hypothetical protein
MLLLRSYQEKMAARENQPRQVSVLTWVLLGITVLALSGIVWLFYVSRSLSLGQLNNTTISHSVAVERVQKVEKLVSSEVTIRDVVTYENTWYGSTKRSLVVVTGRVLAGIDLDAGSSVQIDEKAKRVTIDLPQPAILAVEITELKTYDEQRGLWNAFQAADRDAIFQVAREQLQNTSRELKIADTARQSAREMLESMFGDSGYTVDVVFR